MFEAFVNQKARRARTTVEALELGSMAEMRESDFGPFVRRRDFEDDFGPGPFARVLEALEVGVDDVPNDHFARN